MHTRTHTRTQALRQTHTNTQTHTIHTYGDDAAEALGSHRQPLQEQQDCVRKVLHVQSISSWAPSCIGPYSQVGSTQQNGQNCVGVHGTTSYIEIPCTIMATPLA